MSSNGDIYAPQISCVYGEEQRVLFDTMGEYLLEVAHKEKADFAQKISIDETSIKVGDVQHDIPDVEEMFNFIK